MSTPNTFCAESDAFQATIRRALRAEPGLSVHPDDDAMDTAWVTWGPLDGNGYRINVAVLPGGISREWGDEPHAFVSAAYLDGEHSERMVCLVDAHANDLGDGAALTERLLNALRADRDRPRCPECEGAGSWGSVTCQACGGPGFVGRREEFIDYRPDPYDADEDIDLDDEHLPPPPVPTDPAALAVILAPLVAKDDSGEIIGLYEDLEEQIGVTEAKVLWRQAHDRVDAARATTTQED